MELLRALYGNRWVRYGLTLLLLGAVVIKIQPHRLVDAAGSVRPGLLALALALTLPFLYLKALRWQLMLRAAGIDTGFGEALFSLIGGLGLALVTPARVGEVIRAAYIRDSRKWKIGGLVFLDKGFDVLTLCGLSVAGAWVLVGAWAGAILALVTLIGIVLVYDPRHFSALLHRLSARAPWQSRFESAWSSLDSLSLGSTTVYLLLTLAAFAIVLLQFGIILSSWHSWAANAVVLTFPLVVLTNVLPITVGGLGIREGAAALLLSHYGVSQADASVAAFLMFAVNTALPGIVGALLLPAARRGSSSPTVQTLDPS